MSEILVCRAAYTYNGRMDVHWSTWVCADDANSLENEILAAGDEDYSNGPLPETIEKYPTIIGWEVRRVDTDAPTLSDIADTIDDVLDKCNDIFERVSE